MKDEIIIGAKLRDSRGKNEARRLRVQNMIPAVIYGAFKDPVPVAISPKEIFKILRSASGHNTIFSVNVEGGENSPVMVVDSQFDPVKESLLHVDLKRIDLTKAIRVWIPVLTLGEPKGVKQQGGLLEVITREIEIECLPNEIPEHFTVDVTELMIGGPSIRAADVPLTGSMKLLSQPDAVIAHCVAMRAEEEKPAAEAVPAEGAEAAAAEPEVIKKGKKEEEGAAAEPETKGKKK